MSTVLLLYHCRRLRHELCAILAGKYKVVAAHGGLAAERLLRGRKPDLIVMDYGGNNGSATAVLARLRFFHPRTPVIGLSRFEAPRSARMARTLGARDIVHWPGPVKRLFEAIARALEVGVTIGESPRGTLASGNGGSFGAPSIQDGNAAQNPREEVRRFVHQKR
ncbi:MAG TPA: response regulator [Phycisphaerae bacterium]|nr:response regulator [Phycisphaerae bacterium]